MKLFVENRPQNPRAPILLNAPHGGREFPIDFAKNCLLSEEKRLATADLETNILVQHELGLYSLSANYARAFVDLNRAPELLDFKLIDGVPKSRDLYVRAGYGVLPRYAERGALLQSGKISMEEAQERLIHNYFPYHTHMRKMVEELKSNFGWALILDIHSAPDYSMNGSDIVLGTAKMSSISSELFQPILKVFQEHFTHIAVDNPFSGGHITQKYGNPAQNEHVIQVEIARSLLENENRQLNQDFLKDWDLILEKLIKLCCGRNRAVLAAQ